MTGRKSITTDVGKITAENVVEVLEKAKQVHDTNRGEIEYLYKYYKGEQDIQNKTKETRKEINNKITENRAYEIVDFKKGHVFGEPIQYIRRGKDENLSEDINQLNDYMVALDKGEIDSKIAEWMLICGVGYRMILPNSDWEEDLDEPPFEMYSLDPRNSFVVVYNDLKKKAVMGVTYIVTDDSSIIYHCYTKDMFFKIKDGAIVESEPISLGYVPIIEYKTGNSRLGAFEVVLPLLDAINRIQSNRMDDIEQVVDSILGIFGADMDEGTYKKVMEWKMLIMPGGTDAKYINAALTQGDVQTLKDDLYKTILTICGLPNRNGGSSTSDTGTAVIYRDGWESAETQAKSLEKTFKVSERESLRLILRILRDMGGTSLKLMNIDIKFAPRYADNILTKAQTLVQLLDVGINPEVAISTSRIWNDPTDVYMQSKKYLAKWELEEDESDVRVNGQDTETVEDPAETSV